MCLAGCPEPRRKTLFLIRHGEAVHNILERDAQARGAAEAEALGHPPGTDVHVALVEAARRAVLEEVSLHDAGLSSAGKAQALAAREEIRALTAEDAPSAARLPRPTAVFSSPLQRTLQTTAIIFPEHPGTHIREFLRERRTGLPCDERRLAKDIRRRPSFMHMSSNELQKLDSECCCFEDVELEDKVKLRKRTACLSEHLRSLEDDCICVVTHKGFLRELERGPLGRPDAPEFANCEVRAYELLFQEDGAVVSTLRHAGRLRARNPEPLAATARQGIAGPAASPRGRTAVRAAAGAC